MKVKSIELTNFMKYSQVTVSFDDNVTYLIGKNGSGKSSLGLTGVWFVLQGIAEKSSAGNNPVIGERFRFIGPGGASAKGKMILHDEKTGVDIAVTRKLTKSGTELQFDAPEGYNIGQQWLNDLFNIFLIAPKKFQDLTPKEQAAALGIDTTKFDKKIADLKTEYTVIGREIKGFGELTPVEKVETVDLTALIAKKGEIRTALNDQYLKNKEHNKGLAEIRQAEVDRINQQVRDFNTEQENKKRHWEECDDAALVLKDHEYPDIKKLQKWLDELFAKIEKPKVAADLYPPPCDFIEELPDDSELKAIDQQILDATTTNTKAAAYVEYSRKVDLKRKKEKELQDNKQAQETQENERLAYIKKFKLPFKNLSVGVDGELLLDNKPLKEPYFSTGELLKVIPVLIASRNPELKYIFIQEFNLLDEEKQKELTDYLVKKGFQLVIEYIGKDKVEGQNSILLRDNTVVESYDETPQQPTLL